MGFALALEGLAYAIFPGFMGKAARMAAESGPDRLRGAGVIALAAGAMLIWLAQRFG